MLLWCTMHVIVHVHQAACTCKFMCTHVLLTATADRRPGGGGRGYYRRGPPRRPRQPAQDSQGEDKSEGNEGTYIIFIRKIDMKALN